MSGGKGFKVLDRRTFDSEGQPAEAEETTVADGDGADRPTVVQHLEERTLRAEQLLRQYAERYADELEAQLHKTRERLTREAQRELGRLRGELVTDLLEVLDNLDRSLAALPKDANRGVRQGLALVREQFFGSLVRQGLTEVVALGVVFNPTVHEATNTIAVNDPKDDKRVLGVVKPGYRLGDTLVRPALVQVGRLA